jgi:hypothetical protein
VSLGFAGTIGWMETLGNLIGFLLPIIWGIIAGTNPAGMMVNWMAFRAHHFSVDYRVGMSIPSAGLILSIVFLFLLYWNTNKKRES